MTCSTCGRRWILGAVLAAFVSIVPGLPADAAAPGDDESQDVYLRIESADATEVVTEFRRRLTEYDEVRHRLDASLPRQSVSDDPQTIFRIAEAHHRALRSARHGALEGDIFFGRIADRFRAWIHGSLHGMPPGEFLAMITEADAPPPPRPAVNGSYPDGGALAMMPPTLLRVFPVLPAGLEYRFIDRDLILWDPHAHLIVDVIPNALALSNGS